MVGHEWGKLMESLRQEGCGVFSYFHANCVDSAVSECYEVSVHMLHESQYLILNPRPSLGKHQPACDLSVTGSCLPVARVREGICRVN